MESLLLGGLALAGFNSPKKKKNIKRKQNGPRELDNSYSSNMDGKMRKLERKQAQSLVSSIKEQKPEYFKQFDELTFDNINEPVSINDAHITITGKNISLQRQLNLHSGYSNVNESLNYRVIDKENFTHNNMTPNTSKRDYSLDDSRATRKLEAFTGVNENYVPKQEKYHLFEPMKNLSYVNGMPVFTDYLDDRFLPSNKNNNGNLPFQSKTIVRPGINGENAAGLSGNTVYRINPRNIDALRSEQNQKVSYMNKPLVTIKKGEYRGPDFNLTKYKLPDFRETNFGDLVPNKSEVEGPIQTGKYTNIYSQRGEDDTYYSTPAVNTNVGSGPSLSKTQFSTAKKENYNNDMAHAIGAQEIKPVFLNEESWANRDNQRTTSSHNITGTTGFTNRGSYANDPNYIPQNTIRESTTHNIILGSKPEGGTTNVIPKDIAKKTIIQTTSHDLVLGSKGENASGNVQFSDKAKTTIRETSSHNQILGSKPEYSSGNVQFSDKAKTTIRETSSHNKILGAQPEYSSGNVQLTDKAKITIRETSSHNKILGAQPEYASGSVQFTDKAKITIRETSSHNKILGAQPEYASGSVQFTDKAKKTIRETSSHNKILGAHPEYASGSVQPTDKAKITIRQSTSHNLILGSQPEYASGNVQPTDKAKKTIRETTSHGIALGAKPEYASGNVQPTDKAKKTIRETTSHDIALGAKPEYASGNVQPTDKPKATIRQTTLYTTPGMNVMNPVSIGYTKDDDDKARNTIRQTTEVTQQNEGPVGGVNNYTGYTRDEKDEAKRTIRQTTENSQYEGPAGNGEISTGYTRDEKDEAKRTIRQTTENNQYEGPAGGVDNYSGYARDENDTAKTTTKETTMLRDYTGHMSTEVCMPVSTIASENMSIRETREIGNYNRTAAGGANYAGPQINSSTVKMNGKKTSVYYVPHPARALDANVTPSDKKHAYENKKPILDYGDYYINNSYINTLNDNPYVNDIHHQKNYKF